MVALCILTANGMRAGELLQIRASRDGIVPIQLPPLPDAPDQTPTIHWAVQAIPKGHHAPKTYFFDDEHLRLLSLIKLMLCEHYQIDPLSGAELPKVTMRGTNHHRFAASADHYLFQYKGLGLYDEDIRACLRLESAQRRFDDLCDYLPLYWGQGRILRGCVPGGLYPSGTKRGRT